ILADAEKALTKPSRLGDLAPNYGEVLEGPDEVPSVFTLEGWNFVKMASKQRNSNIRAEACVIGQGTGTSASGGAATIAEAVQRLYIREYIDRWQNFIAGFSVVPYKNPGEAARKLEILSSNMSPLLGLFAMTSNQTSFPTEPLDGLQKNVQGIIKK